jgi:hypothetical protein
MIRSDEECQVYDHTMLNPNVCYMSEQMEFLFNECMKLDMFKDMQKHQIIDEVALKRYGDGYDCLGEQ